MKIILFLLAFYSVSSVYASVVCVDGSGAVIFKDEGGNPTSAPGCTYYEVHKNGIDQAKYDSIQAVIKNVPQTHMKIVNGFPVEMSQSEKDAVDAQLQADQNAAILTRRQQLGTRIANSVAGDFALTDIDTAIDNIQNLADAKVFLKKLVRGVIKLTEGNQ